MTNTPAIKQLSWGDITPLDEDHDIQEEWIAEPIKDFLKYTITKYKRFPHFEVHINYFFWDSKYDLDAAQDAAQAHFKNAIRRCLQ